MIRAMPSTDSFYRRVTQGELARVVVPESTKSWFPVAHHEVLSTVLGLLESAGYRVADPFGRCLLLGRSGSRFFGILETDRQVTDRLNLVIGVRNSTDQSFPFGFCVGYHTRPGYNIAFRSNLVIRRKHTKQGERRFHEDLIQAIGQLGLFREVEKQRIDTLQATSITTTLAESFILRAYEQGIISHRDLPGIIANWRAPSANLSHPTLWSLLNAFVGALQYRSDTDPQRFVIQTMKICSLIQPI